MSILDTNILINKYFEEISKIPHGSYNEERLADYIVSVAEEYNLEYIRDEMHNVIIFKEGSQGYQDHEPVILQAHTDMVCEKNNDSSHDFENDSLDIYIEDGYLHARGTTLGADDGYGVSYMLALLTDGSLKHPPLECVFTVQEEVGLFGAFGLDTSSLKGKRFIGLDSGTEGQTCTSSAGGNDVKIYKSFTVEHNTSPVYSIEIKGLLGGHSGGCIHLARGNANKLAGRIGYHLLLNGIDVRLVDITGGLKSNAIPRECIFTFASESEYDDILKVVQKCKNDIKDELEVNDPGIEILFYENESDLCISNQDSESIISMIYLMMNGMIEQSQSIPNLTTLSLNMGVIKTNDNDILINYSLRSPTKSLREELCLQLKMIAQLYNAYVDVSGDYPGWIYDPHSLLRQQFKSFYEKYTGKELKEVATHGGLETGIFKDKIPELDIITMGPNTFACHTPDEKMDLKSFEDSYILLTQFLETL